MSTPVNTAIAAITENLRTLAGVGPIADYPTEQTGAPWPRVFVYAQNGGWFIYSHAGANGKPTAITIQTMRIRVIVNRSDLPKDIELLMPYADQRVDHDVRGCAVAGIECRDRMLRSGGRSVRRYEDGRAAIFVQLLDLAGHSVRQEG